MIPLEDPMIKSPSLIPIADTKTRASNGMIAYFHLPVNRLVNERLSVFPKLRGIASWEIDSPRSAYLLLEPWMTKLRIQELYGALRGLFGPYLRFGAAEQKTTARAAALLRPVPHCLIVAPVNTVRFLAQVPIHLLPGLGHRTARYLQHQGITTFDSFRRVSTTTIKEWFGVSGLILQQFAHGIDPRVVEPQRIAPI